MDLERLEKNIGYAFKDKELLFEALTHTSYANEHREQDIRDNERLEFLGDAVVNTVLTIRLFKLMPESSEGDLTKQRAGLVSGDMLARIARKIGLGEFMRLGKGEELDNGRSKESLLSSTYEALIGALFLDSSFDTARQIVERHFDIAVGDLDSVKLSDYKSTLLEYCQKRFKVLPDIVLAGEYGPEHDKVFVMEVVMAGRIIGRGEGRNKKMAAQMASREALQTLEEDE